MVKAMVRFGSVMDAKKFVETCNDVDFDIKLTSEPYVINAKSIMGLFSLDLSKPIDLQADCDKDHEFIKKIESYIVE